MTTKEQQRIWTDRVTSLLGCFYANIALFSMCVLTKHFVYKPAKFHIEIYNLLLSKKSRFKCVVAPRGCAKSSVISLCFVLWSALFQQKKFIIIVSDTYTLAVKFLNAIKDEIEHNEVIRTLFGNLVGDVWREDEIVLANGVCIVAKGSGMQIRGSKFRAYRPDLILLDDAENDEAVANKDRRVQQMNWLYGEVVPALADSGELLVAGTILHFDSMLLNVYKDPSFQGLFYKVETNGVPLWEEKYSLQRIAEIRKMYESQGMLDKFFSEYYNEPINTENAPFKKEMIQWYEAVDYIAQMNVYMGVDLAISEKAKADYSVIMVIGTDALNNIYVVDYWYDKADPFKVANRLYEMCLEFEPLEVAIETTAYQKAFQYVFEEVMRENNHYFAVKEIKPDMDKERRLKTILQPRFKRQSVFLQRHHTELVNELLAFPKAKHDDIMDALAHAVMISMPSFDKMPVPYVPSRRGYYTTNKLKTKTFADY